MIFTPLALGAAGLLYILNRTCITRRTRSDETTESGDEDSSGTTLCCGLCPRLFEERVPDDEIGIPFRNPDTRGSYDSFSHYSVASPTLPDSLIDSDEEQSYYDYTERSETSDQSETSSNGGIVSLPVDGEIYEFHHPLIVRSPNDPRGVIVMSTSPPDLLLLPGNKAVQAYSDFMNVVNKTAQGPSVIINPTSPDLIKSKSSASRYDFEFDYNEMDEFDAQYAQDYENFLKKKDLEGIVTVGTEKKTERKVSFNGITKVRAFSVEIEAI